MPFAATAGRFAWLNRHLATASGVLSLAFGVWMAYQIGVVDGLFGAEPALVARVAAHQPRDGLTSLGRPPVVDS